ncbi:MAG TPA: alpha-L-arabinofuranosidase C-terminal domain-containing protein [Tepidisphaeraceae bacterium]|jgi:alpha-N-arabinofuranosidase
MSHARIQLDTHHHVGTVDRRIFGGFAEHLGRCVYEGMYDPGNTHRLIDGNGFRTDVLQALRPLAMPIMRYPGGNFVSCYDWRDGIGPRDKRPVRRDFAWRSLESNQFGTDEFMQWCKLANTEPMMAVNLGTGGAAEAAALLEYCNLGTGSAWADLRKANGHADPYNVKLWCLGNEMDGPWQAGHCPAGVYAQRAREAGAMMKGLDRSIETVACGSSGRGMATYLAYDREVLEYAWDSVDYISAHRYSNNLIDDSAWYLAEGVEVDRVITDYASLLGYVRGMKRSDKQVHLSFDEWNAWYRSNTGDHVDGHWQHAPHLLEEWYNLEDALVAAQYLNAFIRRADVVKVACLAQIVNVIAPIMTKPDGLVLQTIYHAFVMFAQNVMSGSRSLTPVVQSPVYKAGQRGDVPALDVSATFNPANGSINVFCVNRRQTDPITAFVDIGDRTVTAIEQTTQLAGDDLKAGNTFDAPGRVRPTAGSAVLEDNRVRVTVPRTGFVAVRLASRPG